MPHVLTIHQSHAGSCPFMLMHNQPALPNSSIAARAQSRGKKKATAPTISPPSTPGTFYSTVVMITDPRQDLGLGEKHPREINSTRRRKRTRVRKAVTVLQARRPLLLFRCSFFSCSPMRDSLADARQLCTLNKLPGREKMRHQSRSFCQTESLNTQTHTSTHTISRPHSYS